MQATIDAYNAGASVVHIHARNPETGRGEQKAQWLEQAGDLTRLQRAALLGTALSVVTFVPIATVWMPFIAILFSRAFASSWDEALRMQQRAEGVGEQASADGPGETD